MTDPGDPVKDVGINIDTGDELDFDDNCWSSAIMQLQSSVSRFTNKHKGQMIAGVKGLLLLLYLAYFGYCMFYKFGDEGSIRLMVGTLLVILYLVNKTTKGLCTFTCLGRCTSVWEGSKALKVRRWIRRSLYLLVSAGVAVYIGLDVVRYNPQNIQALLGVGVFVALGFVFSTSPARVDWHPVFWGIAVQFVFALLILRTPWGYGVFEWIGQRVEEFINHANAGAEFVFGKSYRDHMIAFGVMPGVLFFNASISVLYHMGVLQAIMNKLGSFLSFCLDCGPIESVVASANIFVGLTEVPLLVRPYLKRATESELHAIMTCGFASVSGGVMGSYIQLGVPANHLLSAAVMSAPAALAVTKLMCPETKKSYFRDGVKMELGLEKHRNILSALSSGAVAAVKIIANIIATMIAFIALIKFVDKTLEWFGNQAGFAGLSFGLVCSYLFYPFSYMMGVATQDCGKMGEMLGVKIFGTSTISFTELGILRRNRFQLLDYVTTHNDTWHWQGSDVILEATNQTLLGGIMDERSEVIATYALCGFSTVTSIGITLGTLVPMAPERKQDIAKLVIRALIAGNVATFMTGSIAGLLYNGQMLQ
ncbi:solute carrier family 28 member 3-like isoform X2 [Haliotis rufescens]|uniref:solute carrier family 28 member 3-like isoform X2 n=1 Tax=Haliotis rufescens TaxID=6454 RepID=UPI00201ECE53|nr:solute carrier family 28 member 3-like isoform X2 [Haliotis rufescens]